MKSGWLFFIAAALILSWSVAAFGQAALQCGDNVNYAFPIPEFPFSDNGTTVGYINDYSYCGSDNAPDVVYGYQAFYDTPLMISLCNGSDFDTKLYVYAGTCTPGGLVGCNDEACPGHTSQILNLPLSAGTIYYIVVDGYNGAAGSYSGKRLLAGAYWSGVTRSTTGGAGSCFVKGATDSVSNCSNGSQGAFVGPANYDYDVNP